MGRESESERLFTENIDRMLAGEEISTGSLADNDLRTALDFAKKMIALRVSPSPQFESRLKAGLLGKLAEREREKEGRQGWFWKLIPSQPLSQALAVLAILLVVGGALFAVLKPTQPSIVQAPGTMTPAITAPPSASVPAATTTPTATHAPTTSIPPGGAVYLRSSASTDKLEYLSGEQVNIRVDLTNITRQPIVLEDFPPTLSLMSSDTGQPVYTFTAGMTPRALAPGETVTYSLTWDQLDSRGRRAPAGYYQIELEEVYRQGQSVRLDLQEPAYFRVLPYASPTVTRNISGLDQPVSINGITATINQIEFTAAGLIVSAFITPPPGYVLKEDVTGLHSTLDYRVQARYAVNGSWFEKAAPPLVEYFPDGMNQTWFVPLPAGLEISELRLSLDNIGSWQGPWEFVLSFE